MRKQLYKDCIACNLLAPPVVHNGRVRACLSEIMTLFDRICRLRWTRPLPWPEEGKMYARTILASCMIAIAAAEIMAAPLVRPAPNYPKAALDAGIEGSVTVEITIDDSGRVINARVLKADPAGWFEEEALRHVKSWTFEPSGVVTHRIVVIDFQRDRF